MHISALSFARTRNARQIFSNSMPKLSRRCPVTRIKCLPSIFSINQSGKDGGCWHTISLTHNKASITVLPVTLMDFSGIPSANKDK